MQQQQTLMPLTAADILEISAPAIRFFAERIQSDDLDYNPGDLDIPARTHRRYIKELSDHGVIHIEHRRNDDTYKITPLRTPDLVAGAAAANFIRTFRATPAGRHYTNFDESDYNDLREKFPHIQDFDFHLRTALKSAHRAERRVAEASLVNYITPHLEKIQERQIIDGETITENPGSLLDPEQEAARRRALEKTRKDREQQLPPGPLAGIDFSAIDETTKKADTDAE